MKLRQAVIARPGFALRPRFDLRPAFATLWTILRRLAILVIGVTIAALGFALFQLPHNIAAGGLSGVAIIVNHYTGWPTGATFFILNIPLLLLGFFYLGRWSFVMQTVVAAALFSFMTDLFTLHLPTMTEQWPLTDDLLLSAVYAGIIGGIGGGLIYRSGATMGGTGIVSRILQAKTGIPLSQMYLIVDGGIVIAAGIVFGWNIALYAMLTLLLGGMASDYVLEGPSRARTATIITSKPKELTFAINEQLGRGVSYWDAVGGYSGETKTVVMCTVYRPQLTDLKQVIAEVDPEAFVSIGVTQQAIGRGFTFDR